MSGTVLAMLSFEVIVEKNLPSHEMVSSTSYISRDGSLNPIGVHCQKGARREYWDHQCDQ